MKTVEPACLWDVRATLGEGVLWDAPRNCVWFVDIKGRRIHRCDPDGGNRRSWDTPTQVGFVVPASDTGYVVGLEDGLHRFDADTGVFTLLHPIEAGLPGNRFNDGHVDAAGRLWCGSMDDAEEVPSGVLYRYAGGAVEPVDRDYVITNGPATSADGRTLYHTDTLKKHIYAFDVAPDGTLENKRLFLTLAGGGHPDGPGQHCAADHRSRDRPREEVGQRCRCDRRRHQRRAGSSPRRHRRRNGSLRDRCREAGSIHSPA